jgi:hypothetical protein
MILYRTWYAVLSQARRSCSRLFWRAPIRALGAQMSLVATSHANHFIAFVPALLGWTVTWKLKYAQHVQPFGRLAAWKPDAASLHSWQGFCFSFRCMMLGVANHDRIVCTRRISSDFVDICSKGDLRRNNRTRRDAFHVSRCEKSQAFILQSFARLREEGWHRQGWACMSCTYSLGAPSSVAATESVGEEIYGTITLYNIYKQYIYN